MRMMLHSWRCVSSPSRSRSLVMECFQEQLVMLQQRLAEKKAKKQAKAPIKREPSPISVPAFSADEIIDLT